MNFLKYIWITTIVVAAIVALLFVLGSIPSCKKPNNPQDTINNIQQEIEKPLLAKIAEKEKQIAALKQQLNATQATYNSLVVRYNKLQKEKENVKPPTNNQEIRDRFIGLGFIPIPAK